MDSINHLSKQNKEILAESMYRKKYSQCDKEQKGAIEAELDLGQHSSRWSKLFKQSALSDRAF